MTGGAGATPVPVPSTSGAPTGGNPTRGGAAGSEAGSGGSGPAAGESTGPEPDPELPLPPTCEARERMESGASCMLYAYCRTQSQITNCERLESGRWRCRCDGLQEKTYEVEGVEGLGACAVAAGACGVPEAELGQERCDAHHLDESDNRCDLNLACYREVSVDFARGARAWLVRDGRAECVRSDTGQSFGCKCNYRNVLSEYELFVDKGPLSCRALIDFCMTEAEPQLTEAERCLLRSTTSSSYACERLESCSGLMELAEDVFLGKLEPRVAQCALGEAGGTECYCATRTSSVHVPTEDTPSDALCAAVIQGCAGKPQL